MSDEQSRYSTPRKFRTRELKEPDYRTDPDAHLAWRLRKLHNALADDDYNDGAVRCLREAALRIEAQED